MTIDEVAIRANDLIVADATGVVVVPADVVNDVVEVVTEIRAEESDFDEEVAACLSVEDLKKRHEGF